MPLRPLLPALALLALPVLAGCGGSSDGDGAPPAAASAAATENLDTVVQAAAVKSTGTSSKLMLTSRTQLNGQDVSFVGEGAFDNAARKGQFTFELPGGAGKIEERLVGDNLYLSLPQEPGVFFKLAVADIADTSLGNTADPSATVRILEVLENVKKTGTEQVRGVEATVYEGTIDPKTASAKLTGPTKALFENSIAKLDVDSLPQKVWIDDQDRVVKVEQLIELPTGLKSTTTIELFDFGTTVTVAEPPAAAVKDGAPLLEALKAAPGVGGPAAPGGAAPASPGAKATAPASPAASPAG